MCRYRAPRGHGSTLVVMFHGYAQDEHFFDDLIPLLPQENVDYAPLRAPNSHGGRSRYWFTLIDSPAFDIADVIDVSDGIVEWLEARRESYERIVLLGFSQGTELLTSVARHRPDLVDGIVMLSGVVVDGSHDYFRDEAAHEKDFPIFLGRDPDDEVLPGPLVSATQRWLAHFTAVTARDYPGLGHRISTDEADDVAAFLVGRLGFTAGDSLTPGRTQTPGELA